MINLRYRIINKIGEGRSKVFLCEDTLINTLVALKVLPTNIDKSEKDSFRQEYFYLQKYNHPNIIKALDFGTVFIIDDEDKKVYGLSGNCLFITLEYFDGKTLNVSLDQLNKEQIYSLIDSISSVLFYLHQANFIYYDLKPENILLKIVDGQIDIRFIDFGFTAHLLLNKSKNIIGSLKYIAPEILNREARNHKADLYSLGVLIYRLMYHRFPFDYDDPLKIYKAQIEGDIEFPDSDLPNELIDLVKILLHKNAGDRFNSCFEINSKLRLEISNEYLRQWNSPKIFTAREPELEQIHNYIIDENNYKPIRISGSENSGKSFLLKELHFKYQETILLTADLFNKKISAEDQLLMQIFFNEGIFKNINRELKVEIQSWLNLEFGKSLDNYRSIITNLAKTTKIVLLIDDIHTFDPLAAEFISNILPLLIVNGAKVIWIEDQENSYQYIKLHNVVNIELKPFSESELNDFFDLNYAYFLPKDRIKEIVYKHSDLLPGNIEKFIDDLFRNSLIVFDLVKGIIVSENEVIENYLKLSISDIYDEQYKSLTEKGKNILSYFSLLRDSFRKDLLASLLDIPLVELESSLSSFEKKNIGKFNQFSNKFEFYSPGLKSFINTQIENSEYCHDRIALWMVNNVSLFTNNEIAYHFEKSKNFEMCLKYYNNELERAKKVSAFNYVINLIKHLLTLPLAEIKIDRLKFELSKVYYAIGDMNSCYALTEELLSKKFTDEESKTLLIQKGNAFVNLGEFQKGIDTLTSVLSDEVREDIINEINISIAGASRYLNQFDNTSTLCNNIINTNAGEEIVGKAYNLLGLVELYKNNNLNETIKNFASAAQYFSKGNLLQRLSGTKINMGNIYVMLNDYENARKIWDEALDINNKIGNLDQEAKLLLNYGVLDYDLNDFEETIKKYNRAKLIFENFGDKNSIGLTSLNLSEVQFKLCNYSLALDYNSIAQSIFEEIGNFTELAEVLFMKGMIFYNLADKEELSDIIDMLSKLNYTELHSDTISLKLKLLGSLLLYLNKKNKAARKQFEEIIITLSESEEREDNYNYAFCIFKLIKISIQQKLLSDANRFLLDKKLQSLSVQNKMIDAEKEYWTAVVKMEKKDEDALENINTAISILEQISITDLTWKVMFLAGLYYHNRGNKMKAEKYFYITKALLKNVEDNLPTEKHLHLFQNLTDIKEARNYIM